MGASLRCCDWPMRTREVIRRDSSESSFALYHQCTQICVREDGSGHGRDLRPSQFSPHLGNSPVDFFTIARGTGVAWRGIVGCSHHQQPTHDPSANSNTPRTANGCLHALRTHTAAHVETGSTPRPARPPLIGQLLGHLPRPISHMPMQMARHTKMGALDGRMRTKTATTAPQLSEGCCCPFTIVLLRPELRSRGLVVPSLV